MEYAEVRDIPYQADDGGYATVSNPSTTDGKSRFIPYTPTSSGGGGSLGSTPMADFGSALTFAALVAATLQYAILVRHRKERRHAIQWQQTIRESLRSGGLVSERRWVHDGIRYRLVR